MVEAQKEQPRELTAQPVRRKSSGRPRPREASMKPYIPGRLYHYFPGDTYISPVTVPGLVFRACPSLAFYARVFLKTTHWLTSRAAKGQCDDAAWTYASAMVAEDCERAGMRFIITGMDVLDRLDGPCVIVANHMSTLETFVLPAIVRPHRPVTFIVKRSLTGMPFFGPVMRSRDPVVVDRKNPREDLTTILREGCDRLERGISVIVFPQSTRALHFDPAHFNTVGVKLARRAGVPVVPLALKTDAWGQGSRVKELGRITPDNDVLFRFFDPIAIQGSGHAEHKAVLACISSHMQYWSGRQQAKDAGRPVPPPYPPDWEMPEVAR